MLSALDRLVAVDEITQLIYEYCASIDEGRFEDTARLFARGVWQVGGRMECRGTDEMLDFLQSRIILYDGRPRTRHVTTNLRVTVGEDGTSATAKSYFLLLQSIPDGAPEIINQSAYDDVFAKDDSGWYFVKRSSVVDGRGTISNHFREQL